MKGMTSRFAPMFLAAAAGVWSTLFASAAIAEDAIASDSIIKPSLTYDGDFVGNLRGGQRTGADYVGNLHLRMLAKAPVGSPWGGTTAFADVMNIHGGSPSARVGEAQGISNLEGPSGTEIEELWVQHNFDGHGLSVLLGIYDLNSEFYRLQSAGLFLNSSFGIGPEFAQTGAEGPSIFPRTSMGVRVSAKPAPGVVLRAALLDGVPFVRPDGSRGAFRSGDGVLGVAEAALLRRATDGADAPADTRQRQGRFSSLSPYEDKLAIGGWRYSARYPAIDTVDVAAGASDQRHSSGAYVVGEARLLGRGGEAKRTISAFMQLGVASAESNRFGSYVGAGLVGSGWVPDRDADQLGLSVARARNGLPYMRAQQQLAQPTTRTETTVELSYLTQLRPWLSAQPDLQYVRHPNTDRTVASAWVAQLRFEIAF